jgi:hypothetical protein
MKITEAYLKTLEDEIKLVQEIAADKIASQPSYTFKSPSVIHYQDNEYFHKTIIVRINGEITVMEDWEGHTETNHYHSANEFASATREEVKIMLGKYPHMSINQDSSPGTPDVDIVHF